MSLPLIKYVLIGAVRDRLILSMLTLFVLGSCLAIFFGSAAIIEKDQFTIIFVSAGLRFVSVFGLLLFVVFFVRRSFDSKDIEFLLSRPIGRVTMIFSYAAAFSILAVIVGLAVGAVVFTIAPHLFDQGHIVWISSIIIENIIIVNAAFFFSLYIPSAASAALAASGFYILGRMMGQLLGITDSALIEGTGLYAMALQLVSVITPRLDLMGQTAWLIYGVEDLYYMPIIVLQGIVFSSLVLLAASLDMVRRQF